MKLLKRLFKGKKKKEEKLNAIWEEEWVKESYAPIPELSEEFQVSESFMRKRFEFKKLIR